MAEWHLREAIERRAPDTQVRAIDLPASDIPPDDRLVRLLATWRPHVVGFSCHYWSLGLLLGAADAVRHLLPQARVILGGPQVSSERVAHALLSERPSVDFVVRSRGDEALPLLLEHGRDPEAVPLRTVPGLSHRLDKAIHHNPESLRPPEARGPIFDHSNRALSEHLLHLREASYETVTGCRCRCLYCVYPTGRVRPLDDDLVLRELTYLCRVGVRHLRICDAHFGGTAGRAKKLLRHLASVNRRTSIKIYPDPLHVDEEYVELVAAAGAEVTSIGIQTTNRACLKRIRRPAAHDDRRPIDRLLEAFPATPADLIIGLPGDTLDGLAQTFRDALAMGFRRVNLFRLHLFPASELGADPARHFPAGKTAATTTGQVLSTPHFPVAVQQDVAQLCHAMEVVTPLWRTRKATGVPWAMLDALVEGLKPDELLDLHCAFHPFHPERLLRLLPWVVRRIEGAIQLEGRLREHLLEDVLEYLRHESAIRHHRLMEWEERDGRRRVVTRVVVPLGSSRWLRWDLRTASLDTCDGPLPTRMDPDELLACVDGEGAAPAKVDGEGHHERARQQLV